MSNMLDDAARDLVARLEKYLTPRVGDGSPVTVTEFTRITGGYSRAMCKFQVEHSSGRTGFVMRADPPPGQSILDTDRTAEWNVLSCLCEEGSIPMPAARWFDGVGDDLGSPAIILDLVDGEGLPALIASRPDDHHDFVLGLADAAAKVHGFDTSALPDSLDRPTSWDPYIDGCIAEWRSAEAAHVEHEPFLRMVAAWLDSHRPPPAPLGLVHGDFQAPNVLVERADDRFLLIDWELTHIGDPREDLGWWALAATSQPPDLIANDEDAFYTRYREMSGLSEEVVNPATVAYFTVLASANVFFSLIRQTSLMTRGETNSMSVGYMTNAMPFMHGVWLDAMRKAGGWTPSSAVDGATS